MDIATTANLPYRIPTPEEVSQLTERLAPERDTSRRGAERFPVSSCIDVQCLDDKRCPVGEVRSCFTRDISATGIGLLAEGRIDTPYLVLKFNKGIVVEVVWQECVGDGRFWRVGARFLTQ